MPKKIQKKRCRCGNVHCPKNAQHVSFTASDKYESHIDQQYGGNFYYYLRDELPMFYRSCVVAHETVVRDYSEYGKEQKKIRLHCIAVAPVIEQKPVPGINPDKFGKPPIGFNIGNPLHSHGIQQIENWLYQCEQRERHWSGVTQEIENRKKTFGGIYSQHDFEKLLIRLKYRISPIVIGAIFVALALLVCTDLLAGRATDVFSSLFFGVLFGAGIGFFLGDKCLVWIKETDGLFFKNKNTDDPFKTGVGGTATPPKKNEAKDALLTYLLFPMVIGAIVGVLALLVCIDWNAGRTKEVLGCFCFGVLFGAGIGILVGDLLLVYIVKKDGFDGWAWKKDRRYEYEQEEATSSASPTTDARRTPVPPPSSRTGRTSSSTDARGTSPVPPLSSGTGRTSASSPTDARGTSPVPPRSSGTGRTSASSPTDARGTSPVPPRSSGTGRTAPTSGSEDFD